MSGSDQHWDRLAKIAEVLFEQDNSKLAEIRRKQRQLQHARNRLEEMNKTALESLNGPHPAHWHDGEFLWQRWVGQNKRQIGLEQARLRAVEESHLPRLRKSFGRREVLRQLVKKD